MRLSRNGRCVRVLTNSKDESPIGRVFAVAEAKRKVPTLILDEEIAKLHGILGIAVLLGAGKVNEAAVGPEGPWGCWGRMKGGNSETGFILKDEVGSGKDGVSEPWLPSEGVSAFLKDDGPGGRRHGVVVKDGDEVVNRGNEMTTKIGNANFFFPLICCGGVDDEARLTTGPEAEDVKIEELQVEEDRREDTDAGVMKKVLHVFRHGFLKFPGKNVVVPVKCGDGGIVGAGLILKAVGLATGKFSDQFIRGGLVEEAIHGQEIRSTE